jgi:Leucine-rich repeat (LRR) protein
MVPTEGVMGKPMALFNLGRRMMKRGTAEAARRIEDAKRKGTRSLNLMGLELAALPKSISELTNLQNLSLGNNLLTAIPDFVARLAKLQILDLQGNQLTEIPGSVKELADLRYLWLRFNRIHTISDFAGPLSKLRAVDLSDNVISEIPDSIGQASQLSNLQLMDNGIRSIPDSIGQLTNLRDLNLNGNRITVVPDCVAKLTCLRYLNLGRNEITEVPDSILRLPKLRTLYLFHNRITVVPESIGELRDLREISLGNNPIGSIPETLALMTNLRRLDLKQTEIAAIPGWLPQLVSLESLELDGTRITEIPSWIDQLKNLKHLTLAATRITSIPDSVCRLKNLRSLHLYNNKITAIPDGISRLTELQELYLAGNQITSIPRSIIQLEKLKVLNLDSNPLPEEVFAALEGGVASYARYLKSTEVRKVYPRTVKLVLLGEPQSGKTTLLEALKGNPHPCDDLRKETIGVDVVNIEKPHPTDRRPIYLSVWDFAGQHIEHATHQFFLTDNAIYLILWNARQGTESGKRDLWYWLELLKMRVTRPKFLLVATHIEHTPPDLNLSAIMSSYPGCEGNFPVELQNLKGVKALQNKILDLAAESPSLRAAWPPEWLSVRDEIRKIRIAQPYMTPTAFSRLLKMKSVTGRVAQKDLASQLHNLGEILYYQERDELSSLVILSPEWVTELIGKVVRSKEVREDAGILSKDNLGEIWKQAKLTSKIEDHLINLMDWFDLTYSTGQRKDLGIVVEALPYSTPEDIERISLPKNRPRMEMIFRFPSLQRRLPPGIPTWGIARAHRFSKCRPWRDAAAFQDADSSSEALILAVEANKEVRLSVAADYPPFFFGVLQSILQDTFRRYPGAQPERRLPCSCQADCPATYLYETVVKRWGDRKQFVTCDKSGEDVPIETLLSGSRRPRTEEGFHALQSEMRRLFTQQLRARNEQIEKRSPSVFTLIPSKDFKQLDTWLESITEGEELELTLYCEHDSGWHTSAHGVYRFTPDQDWFDSLKGSWNQLVGITRYVGPLAKAFGKAMALPIAEAVGLGTEKLPEAPRWLTGTMSHEIGMKGNPNFVNLEVRYLLEELINHLDSKRSAIERKKGGLHPYIVEDGRLLWLCPDHFKKYKKR